MPDAPDFERLPFAERVHAVVGEIPEGRVTSYGAVAALCGAPRAARGVGAVLNGLAPDSAVPWWRVVNRMGALSIPAHLGRRTLQRTLLEREGVRFEADRIPLEDFGWAPDRHPFGLEPDPDD